MNDLPMSERALIELREVSRRFGSKVALDGVSLDVRAGEIVGYVGPNGAGKTTTIKILLGLDLDFDGEVRVAGFDPRGDSLEIKRRVGYVAENAVLYESLTVAEYLLFIGRIHGMGDELIESRASRVLEALDVGDRVQSRIAQLSKGMRQKVLLTAALLHAPPILLLDEPLSGLDVQSQLVVKEVMRRLADSGRAVLFSSHAMGVVERLCDRIAILRDGRLVASGTFEELTTHVSGAQRSDGLEGLFARVTGDEDHEQRAAEVMAALGACPGECREA